MNKPILITKNLALYNIIYALSIIFLLLVQCPTNLTAQNASSQILDSLEHLSLDELNSTAREFYIQKNYEPALQLYKKAFEITIDSFGILHSEYEISLWNLTSTHHKLNHKEEVEKGLKAFHEYLSHPETKSNTKLGKALSRWSSLNFELGDYKSAESLQKKSIVIIENTVGKKDSLYLDQLSYLIKIYNEQSKYELAIKLLTEKLSTLNELYGEESLEYFITLSQFGTSYMELGKYDSALKFFNEALNGFRRSTTGNNREYQATLNNMGVLCKQLGLYEDAISFYSEAKENVKSSFGKDSPRFAITNINLARLYQEIGQFDKSLSSLIEAEKIIETSFGKEHPYYAFTLFSKASVYRYLAEPEKAIQLNEEALFLTEKTRGKENVNYTAILADLSYLYSQINNFEKAILINTESLEIINKLVGKDHKEYGVSLNNLALCYKRLKQYDKAKSLFIEVLQNFEKNLGLDHINYLITLDNLASTYSLLAETDLALQTYKTAVQSMHNYLLKNFPILSDQERVKLINYNNRFLDNILNFCFHNEYVPSEATALAYNQTIEWKGLALNSFASTIRAVKESQDSLTHLHYELWKTNRTALSKQYALPNEKRILNIDSLEHVVSLNEKALFGNSIFHNSFSNSKWQDIQTQLSKSEAAIEFVFFKKFTDEFNFKNQYCALVLRPNLKEPLMIPLFEEAELDSLINLQSDLEDTFVSIYSNRGVIPRKNRSKTKGLYDLIWAPLESILSDVEKVYFSPAGLLHRISFNAISNNENIPLCDRYTLAQLGSTRNLIKLKRDEISVPNDIYLYGSINYDLDSTKIHNASTSSLYSEYIRNLSSQNRDMQTFNSSWNYLPGTKKEVTSIENIFKSLDITTTSYTNFDASEESIKIISELKQSPEIIHLATHGYFFREQESVKSKELSTGPLPFFSHPLLRSGLIMAEANHAWQGNPVPVDMEDGILTAYEISQINLSNTKLVVLSACDSGLGDIKGTEGVFGLQRAFKMAGVENIIMSLWQVPDEQTGELMEKFYTHWLTKDLSIRQAFNMAQQDIRRQYKDPYFWAGFILVE